MLDNTNLLSRGLIIDFHYVPAFFYLLTEFVLRGLLNSDNNNLFFFSLPNEHFSFFFRIEYL